MPAMHPDLAPLFPDYNAASAHPQGQRFLPVLVQSTKVIENWRASLYAFEWVHPDGRLKTLAELAPAQAAKRQATEDRLKRRENLDTPILGIGLLNTIEIGAGKDVFLTLAALGYDALPVFIPPADEKEFKKCRVL
jgi:hypothetical protein